MSELQKLRELLAKAVPTPWELCHAAPNEYWHSGSTIGAANPRDARRIADVVTMGARGDDIHPIHRGNADLIVAAVNALPELLDRLEAAESSLQQQGEGSWISADDVNRLVRELDVALNGEEGAAKQASLCDVVAQVKKFVRVQGNPVFTVFTNTGDSEANFIADSEHLNCPSCGGSGHVGDTQQQGEAVAELWCLHIHGPDDVHPAPSKAAAEYAAELLNDWVARQDHDDSYPVLKGVAEPWPHSVESHAEGVDGFAEQFIYPSSLTHPPKPVVSDEMVHAAMDGFNEAAGDGELFLSSIRDVARMRFALIDALGVKS